MRLVRRAVAIACFVSLMGSATPSGAHISSLQLNDTGFWWPDRVWVAVRFTCSTGEQFSLRLTVKQTDAGGQVTFEGVGSAKGTCSGSQQERNIPALATSGTPETGPGVASVTMSTRAGTVPHAQRKARRSISIVPD